MSQEPDETEAPKALIGAVFWVAVVLVGLCVAGGLAFATLAPHFWRPAPVAAPPAQHLGEAMRSR